MLALAHLTVTRAKFTEASTAGSDPAGLLIAVSPNEVRRLSALPTQPAPNHNHIDH